MRRRDEDYRGRPTSVDWSKLAYMARRRQAGALEVLQDAIETYFPKQFKRAQAEARQAKRRRWTFAREPRHPEEVFVVFDSRTARRRFESKPTTRRRPFSHLKHPRAAPFFTLLHSDLSSKEPMTPSVVVWSTETGKNVGDAR